MAVLSRTTRQFLAGVIVGSCVLCCILLFTTSTFVSRTTSIKPLSCGDSAPELPAIDKNNNVGHHLHEHGSLQSVQLAGGNDCGDSKCIHNSAIAFEFNFNENRGIADSTRQYATHPFVVTAKQWDFLVESYNLCLATQTSVSICIFQRRNENKK
jgi:hypothetical protein